MLVEMTTDPVGVVAVDTVVVLPPRVDVPVVSDKLDEFEDDDALLALEDVIDGSIVEVILADEAVERVLDGWDAEERLVIVDNIGLELDDDKDELSDKVMVPPVTMDELPLAV